MSSSIESKRANLFDRPGYKAAGADKIAAPSRPTSPRNACPDSAPATEPPTAPDAQAPHLLPYGRKPDEADLLRRRAQQAEAHDARAAVEQEEGGAASNYSATVLGGERYGPLSDVLEEIEAMGRRWGELGGRRGEADIVSVEEVEARELGGVSDWSEFNHELEPLESSGAPEPESFGERLKAALAAEAAAALAARLITKPAPSKQDNRALLRPAPISAPSAVPSAVSLDAPKESSQAEPPRKRPAARFVDDSVPDDRAAVLDPDAIVSDPFSDEDAGDVWDAAAPHHSELSRAIARAERSVAQNAVHEAVEAAKQEAAALRQSDPAAESGAAAPERAGDLFSRFWRPLGRLSRACAAAKLVAGGALRAIASRSGCAVSATGADWPGDYRKQPHRRQNR